MTGTQQKIIEIKLGLLNLAVELVNVSRACKVIGYSRDTFYRYKQAVDEGGVEKLVDRSRRTPNVRNRVAQVIEDMLLELALSDPSFGLVRIANEPHKRGRSVTGAGVRGVWCGMDCRPSSCDSRPWKRRSPTRGSC